MSLVPTDQSTGAFLSSPLACAAFFLPLFLSLVVARKDVVAGELPAASATTQVQDGETEGATVEGAEAHVEGTIQGVRLWKRVCSRYGCAYAEMKT